MSFSDARYAKLRQEADDKSIRSVFVYSMLRLTWTSARIKNVMKCSARIKEGTSYLISNSWGGGGSVTSRSVPSKKREIKTFFPSFLQNEGIKWQY